MFIEGGSVRFDLTFFGFHDSNFPLTEQNIDDILARIKAQLMKPYDFGTNSEYQNMYRLYRISGNMDFYERKVKVEK